MTLQNYLQNKFPGLELSSPLFYSWKPGIRFELGINESSGSIHENPFYLPQVYRRAIDLFEALHTPEDELYLVVDVQEYGQMPRQKARIFAKYVKDTAVLYRLQHEHRTTVFPEEDDLLHTHRFSLRCQTSDIKYAALLKAVCNQDMSIRPSIHHPVYFVNQTKGTIFYVYDDRGCDLLATDTEAIRWMFEEYTDWILDYDREEIDRTFKAPQ